MSFGAIATGVLIVAVVGILAAVVYMAVTLDKDMEGY